MLLPLANSQQPQQVGTHKNLNHFSFFSLFNIFQPCEDGRHGPLTLNHALINF